MDNNEKKNEEKTSELQNDVIENEKTKENLEEETLKTEASETEKLQEEANQLEKKETEEDKTDDEEKKKEEKIPFLNKKVNKDTARAFFAGVGTTLILGLALCSLCHNDSFYHKEFHPESPIVNKSVSESFGQSTGYKSQRILDQLHQINREIKEINQKLDNNPHSSFKESSGESKSFSSGYSYGESESFSGGSGFSRGHSYSKSFSETENRDFKIVQNGNKVKLFIYNPSKVDLRFEPEGRRISDHYYIERVSDGKTIIHVDDTVKIFDGR